MARSRRPRAVSAGGAASSRPTSALFKKCGSLRSSFGPRRPSAGFLASTPWRHRNRHQERTAAIRREIVVRAYPWSCSQARKARSRRVVTWSGRTPAPAALPEEGDRLGQVLAVGLHRVGGRVLLEAQVPEEVGQGLVHRGRLGVRFVSPS